MKKAITILSLFLLMSATASYGQVFFNSHVITALPYTTCVGAPVVFTAIDTTGSFTQASHWWNFGDGNVGNSNSVFPSVTHVYTSPGTYSVYFSAWDSLTQALDSGSVFTIVVDSVCANHDYISGSVYQDLNGNGSQDPGELPMSNQFIEILPGPYYITTDQNGAYGINLPTGNYTFGCLPPLYHSLTDPVSGTYSITSTGSAATHSGNDFGLHPASAIQDLRVSVMGAPPVPGINRTYYISYSNVGTIVMNGTVDFTHDPAVNYSSSNPSGSYAGGTVSWAFTNLSPGETRSVNATVSIPQATVIGSFQDHIATINPIASDTTPGNNVDTLNQKVLASYDPNDKLVTPKGEGATGDIAPGTELTYTIRFQNTGTWYAMNIVIQDTLDADLDRTTIDVTGSSHPLTTWYLDNNRLVFRFDGINLPDSNMNEPASHGWVQYKITPKAGLAYGTEINNEAAIYFDFNAPIITNTTINTIEDLSSAIEAGLNAVNFTVAPNPFSESAIISFDNPLQLDHDLVIYDLSGKAVRRTPVNGDSIMIQRDGLPAGLYIISLENVNGKVASGKVIMQ